MQPLRYLSPCNHDRVIDLTRKESIDQSSLMKAVTTLQMIHVLSNINKNSARIKFEKFLESIEKCILKTNGFNILIRNIPNVAQLSETDEQVHIKYIHIRDTLRQFGRLEIFHMIRGTVYAKFSEQETCSKTHLLINNMMMGSNIITSELIC